MLKHLYDSYINGFIIFHRYSQNPAIMGAMKTGNVPIAKLEKQSTRISCSKCRREIYTLVEDKVSGNGTAWAICCCCFGSLLLSFLVLCMDGFREFTHYCPSCKEIVGKYRPSFSGEMICLLVLITLGVIAVEILVAEIVLIPMMHDSGIM